MRNKNEETPKEKEAVPMEDTERLTEQTAAGEGAEDAGESVKVDTAQEKKKKVQKEIISWILTLGSAVLIALMIRTFIFEPIRVDGNSMRDTLHNNEIMFVTKPEYLLGDPQRGDVVICKYPGRTENFVKRLMAVPGDTIEIKDFVVYVNGEAVTEPYLTPENNNDASSASMDAITLGDDEYFVMGDNRDNSHDCRNYYGYGKPATLTRSQIIGHVRFVIFPFSDIRSID
jgi:signal peptidase I